MQKKKPETPDIAPSERVKVVRAGAVTTVTWTSIRMDGHTNPLKRLDKDTYLHKETGEIREYAHNTSRAENIANLRHSVAQFRDIINANIPPSRMPDALFITLTYAENMTDTERLRTDFEAFVKRFRRAYAPEKYMVAMEPQGRGAWHAHLLPVWEPGKRPFVEPDKLAALWGFGFVKAEQLHGDNAGAYVSSYLLHLDGKKGERLYLYPAGFHPFRWSRNCLRPITEYTTYANAKKQAGAATPTYSYTVQLDIDPDRDPLTIYTEQYNTKRPDGQAPMTKKETEK